jgi:hypothetical protein
LTRCPRCAASATTCCNSPIVAGATTCTSATTVPDQFVHVVTRPLSRTRHDHVNLYLSAATIALVPAPVVTRTSTVPTA